MSAAIGLNSVGDTGPGSNLFNRAMRRTERRTNAKPVMLASSPCAVVIASGDLTQHQALQVVYARCRRALELGTLELVIDMSGATRADTKAVAMVSAVVQRARRAGIPVEVRCCQMMRDWMRVCRVERYFNLRDC
ncbi:MAG: STAS domain-containing protein [Phycisphaeraceae bacterium]|nr:STAS domain-containing protein [Phycisphaeraceae bacterium]